MSTRRLTPTDAQTYWLSAKIPNDTFLLFGFAGVPPDLEAALDDVASRARHHPDLTVRIEDGGFLTYPAWVHRDVDRSQFVVHDVEDRTWVGCLHAVSTLIDDQLDAGAMTWRLHVFTGIDDVPGVVGPGTVAVLQISHAPGGGGRTSAHAAMMFGRVCAEVPGISPPSAVSGSPKSWI